jgi:hypothetical protein
MRKRLGRREREARKILRLLALAKAEKVGICSAPNPYLPLWHRTGVPFTKPSVRPWEYNARKAVLVRKGWKESKPRKILSGVDYLGNKIVEIT